MDTLRDSNPMPPLSGLHTHHRTRFDKDRRRPGCQVDRHLFVRFVRNHVVPPAECPTHGYDEPNQADDIVGHQARYQKRKTKGEDHGPEGRLRHQDLRVFGTLAGFPVLFSMFHFAYLPIT